MPLWFPWIALRRPGWACTQRKSFMGVVSVVPKLEDPKLHTFPSEQTNSTRSLTRPSLWYIHWCGICICTKIETCSQSFWQRTSQLTYPQNLKHLLSTKFDSLMAQSFICVVAVAFLCVLLSVSLILAADSIGVVLHSWHCQSWRGFQCLNFGTGDQLLQVLRKVTRNKASWKSAKFRKESVPTSIIVVFLEDSNIPPKAALLARIFSNTLLLSPI